MRQQIATYILPVESDQEATLERLLSRVAADSGPNALLPFSKLPQLHFASMTLFPRDAEGFGPVLVFENNIDGPLRTYLNDLLAIGQPALHQILAHTTGYPASEAPQTATILAHLKAHLRPPSAYHIGNPGRTAVRIRDEARLRETLEATLDDLTAQPGGAGDTTAIRAQLRGVADGDLATWGWVKALGARLTWADEAVPPIRLYASGLLTVALAIALLPVTIAAVLLLRVLELRDVPWQGQPSHEHLGNLGAAEDRAAIQNHMASIAIVKDGPFRRFILRVALWLINLVARTSTTGSLGGIRSIHYAHWSQIDGGRRLLFLSNFDGSWENYLDDFIDRASGGLSMIWSNTKEFPRTRFLVLDGARDGHPFKAVARAYQTRTNVWYSAYPDLTVEQIDRNSTIAEGLFADQAADVDHAWLRLF